jgi:hypothetical protein
MNLPITGVIGAILMYLAAIAAYFTSLIYFIMASNWLAALLCGLVAPAGVVAGVLIWLGVL